MIPDLFSTSGAISRTTADRVKCGFVSCRISSATHPYTSCQLLAGDSDPVETRPRTSILDNVLDDLSLDITTLYHLFLIKIVQLGKEITHLLSTKQASLPCRQDGQV
jgi:hypothetical protein